MSACDAEAVCIKSYSMLLMDMYWYEGQKMRYLFRGTSKKSLGFFKPGPVVVYYMQYYIKIDTAYIIRIGTLWIGIMLMDHLKQVFQHLKITN